jgi:carboxyl-terminal processing protease
MFKFNKAFHSITNYYIDSVDGSKMVEQIIEEMISDLDPHTTYLTAREVRDMNEPLQGNFEGIGIQFNIYKDTIYVVSPISGGPSEKVGLKAGDRIIKIDGENVAGTNINSTGVRNRLLGEKGTKVNVTVMRPGIKSLLQFTITRDKIPIHSKDASYMVDDSIGYIKINRFAQTTNHEFTAAVNELKQQGARSFILDLRNNGGGYLTQAIELADEFLDDKRLIVYTEGRKVKREDSYASEEGVCENENLVILINEGSASASEIVAGAVQDWDRGLIIGRRSFGKGLVQRPIPLPDGSMIRLTVARYHTPTGRVIQKPYDNGRKEYRQDILNRFDNGELNSADSIDFPESLKYFTLTRKRIVYGGGGIMPDIFIPLDTTSYLDYLQRIVNRGIINSYILEYIDKNRSSLKEKYTTFEKFKDGYEVTDKMVDRLVNLASQDGIEADAENLDQSVGKIRLHLKALIARDLWDSSEYYRIINEEDDGYQKAKEVLKNWNAFTAEYLK